MTTKTLTEIVKELEPGGCYPDIRVIDACEADSDDIETHIKASSSRLATAGGRAFGTGKGAYRVSQICTFTADRSGIIYGAVLTRIE